MPRTWPRRLEELGLGPDTVDLALDPDFPADPVVLQRVIVNVLANVERHAPAVTLVRVTAAVRGATAQLCIRNKLEADPQGRRDAAS